MKQNPPNLRMALVLVALIGAILLARSLPAQTPECPIGTSAALHRLQADIRKISASPAIRAKVDTTVVLLSAVCAPVVPAQPTEVTLVQVTTAAKTRDNVRVTWLGPVNAASYIYSAGWISGPVWVGKPETPIASNTVLLTSIPNGTRIWACAWSVNLAGRSADAGCNNFLVAALVPAADTVVVDFLARPGTVIGAPGHAGRMCAFVVFRDGKVARPVPVAAGTDCDAPWAAIPAGSKTSSAVQQAVANRQPIVWKLVKTP